MKFIARVLATAALTIAGASTVPVSAPSAAVAADQIATDAPSGGGGITW